MDGGSVERRQRMPTPVIEGYAVISAEGMIADRNGHMPDGLKHEPDARFFRK